LNRESWDVNETLDGEDVESESHETIDSSQLNPSPHPEAITQGRGSYYEGLVRAAIEGGGRCGGYEISMPWLRSTLARLEGRSPPPGETWGSWGPAEDTDQPATDEPAPAPAELG